MELTELRIAPLTDYSFYVRADYWTLGEAACITLMLDPENARDIMDEISQKYLSEGKPYPNNLNSLFDPYPNILNSLLDLIRLIRRAIIGESLRIINYVIPHASRSDPLPNLLGWSEYEILPLDFINWAESRGIDLPKQLIEAARKYHVSPANEELKSPSCLTDEWQAQICEKARRNGFIARDHLVYILATDEQYEEMLPCLWDEYDLNKRGPKKPNVSTARERIGVWDSLLRRWAFGTVAGTADGLDAIPYLPVYSFDKKIGQLKPYDRQTMIGIGYVKLDELKEYFDGSNVPLPSLLYPQPTKETPNVDEFVKSLTVEVENDSEITIQVPGKSAITHGCESMGFKNKKVKTWKLFLTLLKSPHLVELPKRSLPDGRQSSDYNREKKLLRDLNAKLVAFLNKTYPIELPKNYKLYQRDKSEREGTYRLVFSPKDSEVASRFEKMSKDTLLKTIAELSRKCKELQERNGGNAEDKYLTDFNDACMVALKKKWITEEEINRLYPIKRRDMSIKELYEADQSRFNYLIK